MGSVEEKRSILYRLKKGIRVLDSLCLIFVVILIFIVANNSENQISVQNARILFADAVEDAEHQEYEKLKQYDYYIVDTDGNVIKANHSQYQVGSHVNLHSLSTGINFQSESGDYQFISPLQVDNHQYATLVIEVSGQFRRINQSEWYIIIMASILILIVFIWGIAVYYHIKFKLHNPINEMCNLMEQILNGNHLKGKGKYETIEVARLYGKITLLQDEMERVTLQAKKSDENEKMLLACVSHDIRTPISTIIGCAECIRDRKLVEEEKVEHYTNIIISRAEHLAKLFDSILEQTSVEVNKQSMNRQEIYAKKYIDNILSELLPRVQESGIKMEWEEIPDVLLLIDPERIFRVFQNIIENSLKYTQSGGVIQIKFEHNNQMFAVEISDNGQGIAAVDIPFIFDRFYRGEKARTQKETSGSGLGLSIAKEILEGHGTSIECDSVLGQGTTMRFVLPLC